MPLGRQFPARTIEAEDIRLRRVDPHYIKSLIRLLAAQRARRETDQRSAINAALDTVTNESLRPTIEKNLAEECRPRGARLPGRSAKSASSRRKPYRAMIPALKAPSFEAPLPLCQKPGRRAGPADGFAQPRHDRTADDRRQHTRIPATRRTHAPPSASWTTRPSTRCSPWANSQIAVDSFGPEAVAAALKQWLPAAANFFRAARQRLRLRLHAFRA